MKRDNWTNEEVIDILLDIYEPKKETMSKLLKEMNSLLEEVDQVDKELAELMKKL